MAGKRMKLDLNMPIFKYELVHTPTLLSWGNAIHDKDHLKRRLGDEWAIQLEDMLTITMDNTRFAQSVVELNDDINRSLYVDMRVYKSLSEFQIEGIGQEELMRLTVMDVAQGLCPKGLWVMMILGTWRALVQKLQGPIPGTNFNISVAGIAGTAMRLGVQVEL